MKRLPEKLRRKAFTVLEMTMAMALAMGIAATVIGLLQQQVSFTSILTKFSFLRDDAPQVNTLLSSIVSRADTYRLFGSYQNAKSLSNPVRSNATTLWLRFRNPDGSIDNGAVVFENEELNFYYKNHNTANWPSSPSWTISSKPTSVVFANTSGVLEITMRGPTGEEITYAGNPD
ncbi:MAG: hypothetical protein CMO55_21610 [Verrucomicrobiales bacterium]|nr:hypothetical protein [Verrucomicrobiales bacterium]